MFLLPLFIFSTQARHLQWCFAVLILSSIGFSVRQHGQQNVFMTGLSSVFLL
jgi:hypothetical protein